MRWNHCRAIDLHKASERNQGASSARYWLPRAVTSPNVKLTRQFRYLFSLREDYGVTRCVSDARHISSQISIGDDCRRLDCRIAGLPTPGVSLRAFVAPLQFERAITCGAPMAADPNNIGGYGLKISYGRPATFQLRICISGIKPLRCWTGSRKSKPS